MKVFTVPKMDIVEFYAEEIVASSCGTNEFNRCVKCYCGVVTCGSDSGYIEGEVCGEFWA